MTLPASRNTTYALGTPVKSVDLNAIQDEIVAIFKPLTIHPGGGYVDSTLSAPIFGDDGGVGSDTATARDWNIPIVLPEGAVLVSVSVDILEPSGIGEIFNLKLFRLLDGTESQIGDTITSGDSGGTATVLWDDATNDSGGDFPYTYGVQHRMILRLNFATTSATEEARVLSITVEHT